jgi:hypothetical protein
MSSTDSAAEECVDIMVQNEFQLLVEPCSGGTVVFVVMITRSVMGSMEQCAYIIENVLAVKCIKLLCGNIHEDFKRCKRNYRAFPMLYLMRFVSSDVFRACDSYLTAHSVLHSFGLLVIIFFRDFCKQRTFERLAYLNIYTPRTSIWVSFCLSRFVPSRLNKNVRASVLSISSFQT